jgi:hypothetical protein
MQIKAVGHSIACIELRLRIKTFASSGELTNGAKLVVGSNFQEVNFG